jgi:hypothetical protein
VKGGSESDFSTDSFQTHVLGSIGSIGVNLKCPCCEDTFVSCNHCALSHNYCSPQCSISMRRSSWRAASKRYQSSCKCARNHAIRQSRYRKRRRASKKLVTHHTSQQALDSVVDTSPILAFQPDGKMEGSVRCNHCGVFVFKFYRTRESLIEVRHAKRRRNRRDQAPSYRGSS